MVKFWAVWLLLVMMAVPGSVLAYEFKAGELGNPDGFICHPDWQYFSASEMASNFTADRVKGDAPFTVQFFDTSYGDPEFWSWDFGDGNSSNEQNPVHTYLLPGSYDVALKIGLSYNYETSMATYNNTSLGQFTDMKWSSTARELNFITVAPEGSGTDQPIPDNFYPESKKGVALPSGDVGVVGNAQYDSATITLTPSTQKGYTDTLNINGAYKLSKYTPYNNAY
jgi:PKD repeat protein